MPNTHRSDVNEAVKALAQRNYAEAIARCERLSQDFPSISASDIYLRQDGDLWIMDDRHYDYAIVYGERATLIARFICANEDFPIGRKRKANSNEEGRHKHSPHFWNLKLVRNGIYEFSLHATGTDARSALREHRLAIAAVNMAATRPAFERFMCHLLPGDTAH